MSQKIKISNEFQLDNVTLVLSITVAVLSGLWLWVKHHYSYWKRHNVPFLKANPIFGNFKDLALSKEGPVNYFKKLYDASENEPVLGLHVFHKPCLLIREEELIKRVLITDFNKFSNRFSASDPHSDSLGADNLFFAKNPKWKQLRVKLSPVFTSGKIKQMFPLVEEIGREFDDFLCALPLDAKSNSIEQEVKNLCSLYTTDVIAIVAFGIRSNSLKNPNGDFRKNGQRLFHFTRWRAVEFLTAFFIPSLIRPLRIKLFTEESTKFLRNTLNYVMDERLKSGDTRNDLIDILLNFKKEAEESKDKNKFVLEGDCLVAQAAIFFSAGFETSSSTMSFALYELARHQNIQKRLREEIRSELKKCDGKLTYEIVTEMKYLHYVIQEVLRFYPPLPFLDRACTLTDGAVNYSLKPYSDFAIPNGMPVYIPVSAIHTDAKHFPDPEKFDPDRFAPENKDKNNLSMYMPFGTGPHNCIGERFGLLQSKIGLVNALRNHYVEPCDKTPPEMILEPRALIIQAQGGIHLNIVRDPLL